MKRLLLIGLLCGLFVFIYMTNPPGPARNFSQLEPVILGITSLLGAFILETPLPASCSVDTFSEYVSTTNHQWSYVFTDYSCDLKIKDKEGIFIVYDNTRARLLFEDGTWSSKLDSPHWRDPGHLRLEFPTPVPGGQ